MSQSNDRFGAIRRDFAGTARGPYLDVAVRGLMSRASRAALDRHLTDLTEGTVDKPALFAQVERTRGLFAELIGAAAQDIAFTRNVTDGIATFATSLDWRAGDNVVLCEAIEHPANVLPWYGIARKFGVAVKSVPQRDGVIEIPRILAAIDKSTRVVAISSVSFSPGFRFPVAELAAECRKRGVLVSVDAAQSIGVIATDVAEWDVDAIAVSTQKGLMTVYGAGFLYVRPELSANMNPIFLSRYSVAHDGHEASLGDPARLRLAPGAMRFDVGNPNFPAALAVEPALALLLELGPHAVEDHVLGLAGYFVERMLDIGLPVYGGRPGPHSTHIVTVGETLGAAHDAAEDLDMANLYAHLVAAGVRLSIRRDLLRFSFHIYNNRDDADEVVRLAEQWLRQHGGARARKTA
ncbi:MAG TPA: aminotransferase class V-fold PLP-dependent enzyme [Xanthobacteraceae bacterium]|nr:aminotransferase class V-fold PLP-dependent enzyme [Xanthobacteraceae bacterium]